MIYIVASALLLAFIWAYLYDIKSSIRRNFNYLKRVWREIK